jgi:hypothetical protein
LRSSPALEERRDRPHRGCIIVLTIRAAHGANSIAEQEGARYMDEAVVDVGLSGMILYHLSGDHPPP